jgi:hypothetical protein
MSIFTDTTVKFLSKGFNKATAFSKVENAALKLRYDYEDFENEDYYKFESASTIKDGTCALGIIKGCKKNKPRNLQSAKNRIDTAIKISKQSEPIKVATNYLEIYRSKITLQDILVATSIVSKKVQFVLNYYLILKAYLISNIASIKKLF